MADATSNNAPPAAANPTAPPAQPAVATAPGPTVLGPSFSGRVGGPFSIRGVGFGDKHPTTFQTEPAFITIEGRMVAVSRWNNDCIKGVVPMNFKPGEVTVVVDPVEGKPITIKGKLSS